VGYLIFTLLVSVLSMVLRTFQGEITKMYVRLLSVGIG